MPRILFGGELRSTTGHVRYKLVAGQRKLVGVQSWSRNSIITLFIKRDFARSERKLMAADFGGAGPRRTRVDKDGSINAISRSAGLIFLLKDRTYDSRWSSVLHEASRAYNA